MSITAVKKKFHKLIDEIEDEKRLNGYYKIVDSWTNQKDGSLWKRLSEEEKKELIAADEESVNPKNLIRHEKMVKKYRKWLKK
ncbi:MAG: hypothetical protein SH857_07090 [Chitinophagales bacterium]|nr:hypothetical protein [Chitinophagales bacterium]